jgi:3-hydroxybutyryl-CoA dehydratase
MTQKAFSEFEVGEEFGSYGRTVTEADLTNFTNLAGLKLPMFIDEEFSRRHSLFGTRVLPGLFTASIAAGMLEDVLGKHTLAALELDDFAFKAPVKIGDTLHSRVTVEDLRTVSRGSRGIIAIKVDVINQDGVTPCTFRATLLMRIEEVVAG